MFTAREQRTIDIYTANSETAVTKAGDRWVLSDWYGDYTYTESELLEAARLCLEEFCEVFKGEDEYAEIIAEIKRLEV